MGRRQEEENEKKKHNTEDDRDEEEEEDDDDDAFNLSFSLSYTHNPPQASSPVKGVGVSLIPTRK